MNGPRNSIGWCDFTWNPVTGCLNDCPYCYARKLANGRLRKRYLAQWNMLNNLNYPFAPRFWPLRLREPYALKKPSRIFVCDMGELFGYWVPKDWIDRILEVAKDNPRHTFQFLTKFPIRLKEFQFPDNCWCGTTVTKDSDWPRIELLSDVNCSLHFVSFEPLQGFIFGPFSPIEWVIIGAETGNRKDKIVPKEEWIEFICEQADHSSSPIFMKDNLKPYWHEPLRQEFPSA